MLDVTLYGDDGKTPALRLRELNVGLDLIALLVAQLRAADVRLVGIALSVERLEDGRLQVSGISSERPLTTEELRSIARAVDRVGRLVIADGQMMWLDYTDPNTFHRVDDINLLLSTRGFGYRLEAGACCRRSWAARYGLRRALGVTWRHSSSLRSRPKCRRRRSTPVPG